MLRRKGELVGGVRLRCRWGWAPRGPGRLNSDIAPRVTRRSARFLGYLDAGTPLGRSPSRSSSRRVTSRSRSWWVSHVRPHRFELMVAVDRRRLPSGSASIMSSRPGSGGAARAPPKPVAPLSVEPLLSGCSPRFSSRTGDVKSAELPITASGRRPSGNRSAASLGGQAPAGACGRRLHHAAFNVLYLQREKSRQATDLATQYNTRCRHRHRSLPPTKLLCEFPIPGNAIFPEEPHNSHSLIYLVNLSLSSIVNLSLSSIVSFAHALRVFALSRGPLVVLEPKGGELLVIPLRCPDGAIRPSAASMATGRKSLW